MPSQEDHFRFVAIVPRFVESQPCAAHPSMNRHALPRRVRPLRAGNERWGNRREQAPMGGPRNPTRRAGHLGGLAAVFLALGATTRAQVPGRPSPAPPHEARAPDPSPPAWMSVAGYAEIIDSVDPPEAMPGPTTLFRPWSDPGPGAAPAAVRPETGAGLGLGARRPSCRCNAWRYRALRPCRQASSPMMRRRTGRDRCDRTPGAAVRATPRTVSDSHCLRRQRLSSQRL